MCILLMLLSFQTQTEARFEQLSVIDGLSQSQVLAIAQDQFGFMWFGTQDGLNRYDGYEFRVYRTDSDKHPLTANHIQALLVDENNVLWIGTNIGGLMAWDLNNDQWTVYRKGDAPGELRSDNVWCLYKDRKDNLWVGTMGGGLHVMRPGASGFEVYQHDQERDESLSSNDVRCILEDAQGNLWVGTNTGLNKMFASGEGFRRYLPEEDNPNSLSYRMVFSLASDQLGKIWIATMGGGIDLLDPSTESFTHYRHDPEDPATLNSDKIWSLCVDRDDTLWVGTMDSGFQRYLPESDDFASFRSNSRPGSLSSNKIWSLFEDRSGLLWIGTGDHGINKLHKNAKPFVHVPRRHHEDKPNRELLVTALHEGHDRVWVGTWAQGLHTLDTGSGELTAMEQDAEQRSRLIVALNERRPGELWMGAWGGGLIRLNPNSGEEAQFVWDFGKENHRYNVTRIEPMGERFVITTYGDGMMIFDPTSKTYTQLEAEGQPIAELTEGNFLTALPAPGGELWLGKMGKGLCRVELDEMKFTLFTPEDGNPESLPGTRVTVLHRDQADRLWIGTDGAGLSQYMGAGRFATITTKNGLPNNVINGIMDDAAGNLWITTNKGIDCFNPETGSHRTFSPDDGVQLEYNAGVYTHTESGLMLFGSPKGIDYFKPEDIRQNQFSPSIVLSGFKIFNNHEELAPLNTLDQINLDYTDNFISFEFAAMDFTSPSKNVFAVQMVGFDKEWVYNGNRNFKEYTNLSGGDYTFRVKGTNGDGVWNEVGTDIRIKVKPPFWENKLFLVSMALLIVALVVVIVKRFEARKLMDVEHKRAVQIELNRRLSEAREVERLRIAQEIHDGPIQDLHAIQFQMSLNQQGKNSNGVGKYLVSVISNLRRLCGHLRPPALVPFGLAAAIRSHVETLRELNPNTTIVINLENDGQTIPEDMRLALFRISQEALNNAIQHGECELIRVLFKSDAGHLHLEIIDDGKGFELSESLLEFSSTGHYGLLGISERSTAIGGNCQIQTAPGQGTRVKVMVPKRVDQPRQMVG